MLCVCKRLCLLNALEHAQKSMLWVLREAIKKICDNVHTRGGGADKLEKDTDP